MKLLKSEKIALVLTLVFLALALGFSLGRRPEEARFVLADSSFTGRGQPSAAYETVYPPKEDGSRIININTCSAEELESLPGIGPVLAQRIIDYRGETGGFKTIEDITKVRGIGAMVYEDVWQLISVN